MEHTPFHEAYNNLTRKISDVKIEEYNFDLNDLDESNGEAKQSFDL